MRCFLICPFSIGSFSTIFSSFCIPDYYFLNNESPDKTFSKLEDKRFKSRYKKNLSRKNSMDYRNFRVFKTRKEPRQRKLKIKS